MGDSCKNCGKKLVRDEIAINLKLINKGAKEYLCITCLADYFKCSEEIIYNRIEDLRASGCSLFPQKQ